MCHDDQYLRNNYFQYRNIGCTILSLIPYGRNFDGGKIWQIYCKNILAEINLANSVHSQGKYYAAKPECIIAM